MTRRHSHWQPKEHKAAMADDVREWVQRINQDPAAKMESLEYMLRRDLTDLMLAVHRADEIIATVRTAAEVDGWPMGWGLVQQKIEAATAER